MKTYSSCARVLPQCTQRFKSYTSIMCRHCISIYNVFYLPFVPCLRGEKQESKINRRGIRRCEEGHEERKI